MDLDAQVWFRGPKDSQPFSLSTLLNSHSSAFHCVACFPWTTQSLGILWGGNASEWASKWQDVAKQWMGAIVVGGTGLLCIFPKLGTKKPIVVKLSEASAEIENVAWAINREEPLKPLIVFTVASVILIYDATTREIVGKLRGHGGHITSLAVHPTLPELFCTTSRDFTARVYDLTLTPVQHPNNPRWFPNQGASLAGPAHGLHMCEEEGEGIGQAVAVMVGGRSGGHRGAVLCCAFHPSQPSIATGGMDRTVKIWRIPPSVFAPQQDLPTLAREDKPLFSTDLIHKARVLSVSWLTDEILMSCSAPALMRYQPEDTKDTYWEDGTVVTWQWLGFNRFFPPGKIPQKVMRGTASDWRNSESFKILSGYHIPSAAKRFHIYHSLNYDPLLLIPIGKVIRIFNISQFSARQPPKFPLDGGLVAMTNKLTLGDEGRSLSGTPGPTTSDKQTEDEDESGQQRDGDNSNGSSATARDEEEEEEKSQDKGEEGESSISATTYPSPAPLATLFDSVEGWEAVAEFPHGGGPAELPDITTCVMAFEGLGIVGIGDGGSLYVWRLKL